MKKLLLLATFILVSSTYAQVVHYDWPTGTGEAVLSDKYRVFVKHGTDPEEEIEVLMSNADPNDIQYDGQANELMGRTFSYAAVSYNNIGSPGVSFRIVKTFGNSSTNVKISPKSYNIAPTVGNNEVSFTINSNNKYISVNFADTANETATKKWIKHMLTIYVDPPETGAPNPTDAGVVVYSNSLSPTALLNANTIYFPAGYHNLKYYNFASSVIDEVEGFIYLGSNKKIYLEGGAFVEGLVSRTDYNTSGQKIYGRGILSGRQYQWQDGMGNKPYGEMVLFGLSAEINGVHIIDSPKHGIVARDNMLVENLKFLGWHANNDGIRIGSGSEIRNSFMRCVDDFFYNYNNYVHDCVFWAGHNGAIVTYGWASIDTGSSFFENIDIINPEWTGLGNNNGLIAAQCNLDFNPIDYGTGQTTTTFKDIRIEGSIPGITNVKPRSSSNGIPEATQVPVGDLGYLGDIQFENITVENQFAKGRLRGQANATTTGNNTFFTKNINFTNVFIGGTKLTNVNSSFFFEIDASTTQNITFDIGVPPTPGSTYIENFDSEVLAPILQDGSNPGLNYSYISSIQPGDGKWFTVQGFGTTDFGIQTSGGNPSNYVSRISETQFGRGLAYVYNNIDNSVSGTYDLSFDYFFNTSFDNASTTNERFGYRVWGINSTNPEGVFVLTSGSGDFGDDNSTNYTGGTDGVQLKAHTHLPHTNTWTSSGIYSIDFGPSGTYKYFILVFGQVFGTIQTGNPVHTYFGIDNVKLPSQANPLPTVLSFKDFEKNLLTAYPNPTKDKIYLRNLNGDFSFKIFDVSGKLLMHANKNNANFINVSTLKNGMYFLEVFNNNKKSTIKIIKN